MALRECKLCGKVFTVGSPQYCYDCIRKLGDLYGSVHEYMRDHEDEVFDISTLAAGMDVDPVYIKALVDLGYITSLMQENDTDREQRKKLAEEFSRELGKITGKINAVKKTGNKSIFYGGERYSRRKS